MLSSVSNIFGNYKLSSVSNIVIFTNILQVSSGVEVW